MRREDNQLRELFAEARAIHIAMQHGAITYEEAKVRTYPLLQQINEALKLLAKEFNRKPKRITFFDLGRNI